MAFSNSKDKEVDEFCADHDSLKKWEHLEASYKEDYGSDHKKRDDFGAWQEQKVNQSDLCYEDRNVDLFDLRRVAMEHQRPPFPDLLFEILDNEVDTDDNGGDYDLETGSMKNPPSRTESWEDNWLFQKRKPNARAMTSNRPNLASTKMYDTIDEQHNPDVEDYIGCDSDTSEKDSECKLDEVRRVERPCVRTSSSSSDAEDSEEVESSDPSSENVGSPKESDENIPFLQAYHSSLEDRDSHRPNGLSDKFRDSKDSGDEQSATPYFEEKEKGDSSSEESSKDEMEKNEAEGPSERHVQDDNPDEEMSDDSAKEEDTKHHQARRPDLSPDKELLPALLSQRSHSPTPGSGTRSCASEDSSSDELEKMAAACKPRRRASWCPLESPGVSKKRGKRRPPPLPLKLNENDEEQLEKEPSDDCEGLVGLERQVLYRNAHHSSFRAKKASSNFVLNPLYDPDGDGAHNRRRGNAAVEPVDMQQINLSLPESGYSSCSPDSHANHNSNLLQQGDQNIRLEARVDGVDRTGTRMPSNQNDAYSTADLEDSFLW